MDINKLQELFGECEISGYKIIIKNQLHKILEFIKDNYEIDFLKEIIAIDCGNNKTELIYHLFSTINEEDIFISIEIENEAESIVDIYKSAEADENEIYDLFGINFIGHKNLKRLYMPENWNGHPLRKDYIQQGEQ